MKCCEKRNKLAVALPSCSLIEGLLSNAAAAHRRRVGLFPAVAHSPEDTGDCVPQRKARRAGMDPARGSGGGDWQMEMSQFSPAFNKHERRSEWSRRRDHSEDPGRARHSYRLLLCVIAARINLYKPDGLSPT
jgi:hypothetical protein